MTRDSFMATLTMLHFKRLWSGIYRLHHNSPTALIYSDYVSYAKKQYFFNSSTDMKKLIEILSNE